MEAITDIAKKKISELKNYDNLKALLKHSFKKNIDTQNLLLEEYIVEIHKIIFNNAGLNSEEEYVNNLETIITCLIENSDKISDNENLFKYLSSFIQIFFDLLIKTLKEKANTNISQFSSKVLALLNSEELLKNSGLNEKDIQALINLEKFNKAYNSLKSKIINKFACYILLFFPEHAKNKEDKIHTTALKFYQNFRLSM